MINIVMIPPPGEAASRKAPRDKALQQPGMRAWYDLAPPKPQTFASTQHRQPHLAARFDAFLGQRAATGAFLDLPLVDLLDQRIDHFAFLDVADDFAALEDDALALAGGDAEVRLARLAGAVDHAAEDAH